MARPAHQKDNITHLQPPQSYEAEQAVLGSILKDSEAIAHVLEVFDSPHHFYNNKHQIIFQIAIDLFDRSEPRDITTVSEELIKLGKLDEVGGRVYLVELAASIASSANVASHANIILEKSLLRKMINTSNQIVRSCYLLEQPVYELLDVAETNIFDISEMRLKHGFVALGGLLKDALEQLDNIEEGGMQGFKTGFTKFDEMTLGLHRGELIVIAGRPSMGKTALALNIAENFAEINKKGVGIFSIEMSKEQLAFRMLCGRARLNQQKLRSGKLRDEEWQKLTIAGHNLSEAKIFIDDSATLTPLELRAKARRLKKQHDVELIIVDYLQLMHAHGRQENRQQEISLISRSLKALAKELSIPVIAISQLSRQVEQRGKEKIPQLSDLRESGAIEQDADVVAFVYRPEFYLTREERMEEQSKGPLDTKLGKAQIIIAKQRNGPTGVIDLAFVAEFARFENLETLHPDLPAEATPVRDDEELPPF
ncbi:MAG: replicative DNA helicase [candidate division Zixibacteria bacterium]|nr:replicative DNA helicase [candidate division Zixibacteria bacterium]